MKDMFDTRENIKDMRNIMKDMFDTREDVIQKLIDNPKSHGLICSIYPPFADLQNYEFKSFGKVDLRTIQFDNSSTLILSDLHNIDRCLSDMYNTIHVSIDSGEDYSCLIKKLAHRLVPFDVTEVPVTTENRGKIYQILKEKFGWNISKH